MLITTWEFSQRIASVRLLRKAVLIASAISSGHFEPINARSPFEKNHSVIRHSRDEHLLEERQDVNSSNGYKKQGKQLYPNMLYERVGDSIR